MRALLSIKSINVEYLVSKAEFIIVEQIFSEIDIISAIQYTSKSVTRNYYKQFLNFVQCK